MLKCLFSAGEGPSSLLMGDNIESGRPWLYLSQNSASDSLSLRKQKICGLWKIYIMNCFLIWSMFNANRIFGIVSIVLKTVCFLLHLRSRAVWGAQSALTMLSFYKFFWLSAHMDCTAWCRTLLYEQCTINDLHVLCSALVDLLPEINWARLDHCSFIITPCDAHFQI